MYKESCVNGLMQIDCDTCGCILHFSAPDLVTGEYGCAFITCPQCGTKTAVPDKRFEKRITADNVEYPKDFSSNDDVKSTKEVQKGIRRGLEFLKQFPEERSYFTWLPNGAGIIIVNNVDIYSVFVVENIKMTYIRKD